MEFLDYLRTWKENVDNRPGNFTQNARNRMLLSWQTYEGFQISVHSAVEVARFLLQQGFEFVLTERFSQDPVEEYFGGQRKLGRRSDNYYYTCDLYYICDQLLHLCLQQQP